MGSTSLVVLLLAAASVAIFHAILPDHWMPIAVVARTERWPLARTARVAVWTGVGHVVGSVLLGIVVIVVGFGMRGIVHWEGPLVGVVLVLTGIGLFLWSLRPSNHGHSHPHPHAGDPSEHNLHPADGHAHDSGHHHHHDHDHSTHGKPMRAAWIIPAGIAASPDPTILPIFLAASAINVATAIDVLMVYAIVTIVSMGGLTIAATWGGYQVKWTWLE